MKLYLCVVFTIFHLCVRAIPVGKFLSILDKSLVYQLSHPTTNINSVRFLIEDLRAYKENLFRLTKRLSSGRGYVMEHAKNLSLSESPVFLRDDIDFERLRKSFNLTEAQAADVEILVSQIKENWNTFLKVSNQTELQTNADELPFFLIEKAGNNILEYISKPSSNVTFNLFRDLSNYYYGLGKLLKLFNINEEEMCEKSRPLYNDEKPVFLRRYLNFPFLKSCFEMNDIQAVDFKKWISKILFRWKTFTGFYEKKSNFTGRPNLNNFNNLVNVDNELKDIISSPIPDKFNRAMELLDSFFETLGLILRRNYPFREDIINHIRATYTSGPPLFLRKYINFNHLKDNFKIDELMFSKLRKKIYNIKNRWDRLNTVETYTRATLTQETENDSSVYKNRTD